MDEDYGTEYDDSGDRTVSELEGVHSTLQEILSTIKSRTDLSGFFWLVLIILFVEGWSGSKLDRWTDKVWHSIKDDADFRSVTVEKRPLDCDFLHAPLGGKGCEYEKRTLVQPASPQSTQNGPNTVVVYWEKKEY
jgi:hypothetical protein